MAESKLKRAQRAEFKRYKDDVKHEGKPFFPYAMSHDTIVAIVAAILVVISMGTLTWKGAVAKESLGAENLVHVPAWAASEGYANDPQAVAGAKLFAQSGCMNCHTYLGAGSSNLGAPDLSA